MKPSTRLIILLAALQWALVLVVACEDMPPEIPWVDVAAEPAAVVLEAPAAQLDAGGDYCGHPPAWALASSCTGCNLYNGGACYACTLYQGAAPLGSVEGHCSEIPCCHWGTP